MGIMSSSWRSLASTAESKASKKIIKRIEHALKIAFHKNPDPRALTAEEVASITKMCDELTYSDCKAVNLLFTIRKRDLLLIFYFL
jgi:hypothetical protein